MKKKAISDTTDIILVVRSKFEEIETIQQSIATARDKLRDKVGELQNLLDSVDTGLVCFEDGLAELEQGLDYFSELL